MTTFGDNCCGNTKTTGFQVHADTTSAMDNVRKRGTTTGNGDSNNPSTRNVTSAPLSSANHHQNRHGASSAETRPSGHSKEQSKEEGISDDETENIVSNGVIIFFATVIITAVSACLIRHTEWGGIFSADSFSNPAQDPHPHHAHSAMFTYTEDFEADLAKHNFGSPDLLTEDLKRKVLDRASHNPESLQDLKRELKAERLKYGGESYLTIDAEQLRKKTTNRSQFIVIFDAGSTGTRVHILGFRVQGSGLKLESEVFHHIKPGLSEFVNDPDEAVANISPLVKVAMETVPRDLHGSTPLIFKATAGLRLLDPDGAERLLDKVRELMSTTDFSYGPDDISVMGGVEEGLYGWITVNYLLGHLDADSVTAATLDLGGGSVQVTHEPVHLDEEGMNNAEDMKWLEMFGNDFHLYTHSYLGHGLKAARNNTFRDGNDGKLYSHCLPANYTGKFHYNGVHYTVRGPNETNFDACWQQVGSFLSKSHMMDMADSVRNPQTPDVFLFSYFYDCLLWAGGIEESETENIVTVKDYFLAAKQACHVADPRHPFLCQDLTYIVRLLGEVFMLWDRPLHVVKKIKSREASWAIGAALASLSTRR